jgi:hypothetical protein
MRLVHRLVLISGLAALIVLMSATIAPSERLAAQDSGVVLWDLGSQPVSGATWQFDGDFAIAAGAWESLTISNYGYCWVGPNDPRAGTAHADAVFWFTELQPQPPATSGTVYSGTLKSERSAAGGDATITSTEDPSGSVTHVHLTISGSGLTNWQDEALEVCLLGSS